METHIVKIISIRQVTHNVRSYQVEKPLGYHFDPGQATEVCINRGKWKDQRRPFTFTGLNKDPYLEFTIKSYTDHPGVTNELYQLQVGDELILHDVWGAIAYHGPGYFIAGGAGITPFIAILRQLSQDHELDGNELFFSNKTAADIIYQEELDRMLGSRAHYILTQEDDPAYLKGPMDGSFLQKKIRDFSRPFYVCGPDNMVVEITAHLSEFGARPEGVIFEH